MTAESLRHNLQDEGGYSLVEMITVMAILGVVLGGIVTLFTAGIRSDADQNARFQAQQDTRLALDKVRRDVHSACTISTPNTYNTWASSVTLYYRADSCASGASSITWCTSANGSTWTLYRVVATTCTGSLVQVGGSLTAANIFAYIPPNSHLATSTSVGTGTAAGAIATQDASYSLPRLHVDLTVRKAGASNSYRLIDDIAFRNGPRTCAGVATC
jgi:prepilin-type N-terminal cleavage/methylation domain-containing protein